MKLQISHTTRYLYSDVVSTCHSEAHLTPRPCPGQTVLDYDLSIDPAPDFSTSGMDYFGNPVTMFSISQPHRELTISRAAWWTWRLRARPGCKYRRPGKRCASARSRTISRLPQFVFESPLVKVGEPFAAYAAPSFTPGRPILDAANDLVAPDL